MAQVQAKRVGRKRDWPARLVAAGLALAALLVVSVWLGMAQSAFVPLDSIHTFYFQQSYAAGPLPLALGGVLIAMSLAALWRARVIVPLAVPVAVLAGLNEFYSGRIGLFGAYIHPMQIIPRLALGLTVAMVVVASLLVLRRRVEAA